MTRWGGWLCCFTAATALLAAGGTMADQPAKRPTRAADTTSNLRRALEQQEVDLMPNGVRARVSTAAELAAALRAAQSAMPSCDTPYAIWIENTASIDLAAFENDAGGTDYLLAIPACVTLASGRNATRTGGLLHLDKRISPQLYALTLGDGARVTGLHIKGPYGGSDPGGNQNGAIRIAGVAHAMVDNNEIDNWPHNAVEIDAATNSQATAQQIEVQDNFIHNNVVCGSGYGVVIGKAGFASVDENLFDYNRHAVAGDGCVAGGSGCIGDTGYIAQRNFVLAGGAKCEANHLGFLFSYYNQHFDMHGLGPGCGSVDHCGGAAGKFFDIRFNAIRGAQTYYNYVIGHKTRPALQLRGTPVDESFFRDNAVAHPDQDAAISTPDKSPQPHLTVANVQYNTDTSHQLAAGDFDGDGAADVFQATGQIWVYAPNGQREWHYLNQSSIKMSGLAFGDFNGDGVTDVFTQEGDQWLVSYGGRGPWTKLPAGSNIPMKNYGFADFDGDGKTDIFESNGQEWFYSSGAATPWQHLNFSKLGIKDIRFGHFNPKEPKKSDIFAIVNGAWSVSFGGTSKWAKLNNVLWPDIGSLVFADFNGDGVTDIALGLGTPATRPNQTPPPRPTPINWSVSWSGTSPWQGLQSWMPAAGVTVPPLPDMLVADFDGDKHADVINQQAGSDLETYFFWSKSGTAPLGQRSVYPVQ